MTSEGSLPIPAMPPKTDSPAPAALRRVLRRARDGVALNVDEAAVAMTARGFAGPGLHIVHPAAVPEGADGAKKGARVSFGATLCAVLLACAALARAAVSSPA